MRYLIVRTEVRNAELDEVSATIDAGCSVRDELTSPEPRRQTFSAVDRDAALLLARALSSSGAVRKGRQRIKVICIGEPRPLSGPLYA